MSVATMEKVNSHVALRGVSVNISLANDVSTYTGRLDKAEWVSNLSVSFKASIKVSSFSYNVGTK